MTNFNFKKQTAIIFTILGLFVISPIITFAQEATRPADCQVTSEMTDQEKLVAKQKCNEALMAQDQEKLATIRANSKTSAIELCRSDYTPVNDGYPIPKTGQYVPVHETGKLLNLTKSTNERTENIESFSGKSYEMFMKLCLYSHEIKRVQYAMENLTFIQEPNLQRLAASKIEEYKLGLLGQDGQIQTGYLPSGEFAEKQEAKSSPESLNKTTLYPENLESYLADARNEGYGVFMDNFSYSNNIFRKEVGAKLQIDEQTSGLNALDSSITRTEYNDFMDPTISKDLPADEWWGTFLAVMDINKSNNPYTSYLNAQKELGSLKSQKENIAEKEYQTNGGFLPIRECIAYTSDGLYCRIWKTLTPGQLIQQSIKEALATKLQQYLDPTFGKINEINIPTTNDIEDLIMEIPDINFNDLIDQIIDIFGDDKNKGDNNNNGNGDNQDPTQKPTVEIVVKDDSTSNTRQITWASTNTKSCSVKNDWLGRTNNPTINEVPTESNLVSILKYSGQNLDSKNGELAFPLPLGFQFTWYHNDLDETDEVNTTTEINSDNLQVTTWTVPIKSAWLNSTKNDSFAFKIVDAINPDGYLVKIGGANASIDPLNPDHVIKLFEKFEDYNEDHATVYKYYKFTYTYDKKDKTPANMKIELKEPVYKITCVGNNGGEITKSTK